MFLKTDGAGNLSFSSDLPTTSFTGATAETSIAGSDLVLIYDDSATAVRKMTRTNFVSGLGGLTEADQWRLTTDLTGDQEPIASNLERNDSTGFSLLGTGMTQSSGIFTFPSTGYWYITAQFAYTSDVTDNQKTGNILITTDNSTYATGATCVANFYSSSTLATTSTSFIFDVTSTTNCKVKFETGTTGVSSQVTGSTTQNRTFFTFIRIGDT